MPRSSTLVPLLAPPALLLAALVWRRSVSAKSRRAAVSQESSELCVERAARAPTGTHATDELIRPAHIGAVGLGPLMRCDGKGTVAENDYKYWTGADQPWRSADDTAVTDPDVIVAEEQRKLAAEAEDQGLPLRVYSLFKYFVSTKGTPAHAEKLRCYGVRVDFLLGLTFALDMWEWKTWEVVRHLVKPMTEREGRCRFAELEHVRPFTGAATVFMSHCWGGRWGDLVAAACAGADTNRVVW